MTKFKSIVKLSSSLLYLLAVLLLIPIILVVIYMEGFNHALDFIIPAIISALVATIFALYTRGHKVKIDLSTAMMLCSVSWVLLSIIGALPFMFALNKSFTDAFFESVSGFTTTGITVFTGLDSMNHGILFYRSMIQWLGGLGILTFFLFVTTNAEGDIWQLFSAEGHKIGGARPVPNVYRTIRYFWGIYGGLTAIEVLILKVLGLNWFESVLHSLSTLSTGGFSNHDASIAYYGQAGYANYIAIEYVITLFMFFGGVNFLIHYKMLKEDKLILFKDVESKTYIKIILSFTGLTLLGIWMQRGLGLGEVEEAFRTTIFQMVSLMTTTGFGTMDIGSTFFPAIAKQLFIVLMIIGGSVGSTSGGIKVLRVIILTKLLRREIDKIHLPRRAVLPTTVDGNIISQDEISRISALIFGWMILILLGSMLTALFSDLGPFEAFSGMASAVGNIGPFYFSVDKMISLSPVVKYTFAVGMLAGRLELIPLYVFISRRAFR